MRGQSGTSVHPNLNALTVNELCLFEMNQLQSDAFALPIELMLIALIVSLIGRFGAFLVSCQLQS